MKIKEALLNTYFMIFYWAHFLYDRPNKSLFTNDLLVANVKNFEMCFFPQTKKTKMSYLCEVMQHPTEVGASEMDGHECAFCHPEKGA